MNPTLTLPSSLSELKQARPNDKWSVTLAEERRRFQEDLDVLRDRENNLREYEARLRAWQAEIDSGRASVTGRPANGIASFQRPSRAPFVDNPALQTAWEKLYRARELLEAEQTYLRDERIAFRDMQEALKRREEQVADREATWAEREALAVREPAVKPIAPPLPVPETATRISRGPFEMACSVFRGSK